MSTRNLFGLLRPSRLVDSAVEMCGECERYANDIEAAEAREAVQGTDGSLACHVQLVVPLRFAEGFTMAPEHGFTGAESSSGSWVCGRLNLP
jgi:hypothetical protein